MNITFVGGGNMATALIGGLERRGLASVSFRIVEPLLEQRDKLGARFPHVRTFAAPSTEAISGADVVVLAVKPQHMREAATAVAPSLDASQVVLTIAAGIRLDDVARWLDGHTRLVRAMPNTPALIGKGISGAFAAPGVDAAGRDLAGTILEAGGELLWVDDEAMLDAITAVSGSGPAYVFYFLEAVIEAARDLGFGDADARKLALATFSGALALLEASNASPAVLRAQVTSKGGTTERAIATMEVDALKMRIMNAVKAAAARAQEMGEAFGASR